jgi:ubiquinone/menaquinone biosynthesis C-methylase UbiE
MTDLSKHPTDRFSGLAEIYAKSRPSYPAEAVDYVVDRCRLNKGSILIDIGSGTGISSRLFASQGITVTGIEPNDDMRTQAEREGSEIKTLTYKKGTAEKTGVQSSAADAVLCAQAFHWFEPRSALAEFRRILKPGGWVVLIWNERDEKDAFTKCYGDLLRQLPETASVEVPRGLAGQALLDCEEYHDRQLKRFINSQVMDEEGLIGRAFSASYAPKDKATAEEFTTSLRKLFAHFAQQDKVSLIYETSVYSARK